MIRIENNSLVVDTDSGSVNIAIEPALVKTAVKVWKVPVEYRPNGLFVAVTPSGQVEEVPACNMIETEYLGELVLNPDGGAELMAAKKTKLIEINASFNSEVSAIVSAYPEYEMRSWPQQIKDAEALAINPSAQTPLLSAIATERGITIDVLASSVLAKMALYSTAVGAMIGKRHAKEALIEAAGTHEALALITWG